tara:strand:+ start:884 stop:1648 length:765 start_codon:yes stop_codon:yes gene_type:complete
MADNLYSDGAIPEHLEDVNPNNNPYNLLSKAIEDMNSSRIIELFDKCERDIFLITIVSDIDNILAHGSDDLLYFLGNKLITHEYVDTYNKLYMVNEFRKAVKAKDSFAIMRLTSHISENIYLPYIVKNLDELLKTNEVGLCSQLATCLVISKYRDEYDRVCKRIKYLIEPNSYNDEKFRGGTLSHVPLGNAVENDTEEWETYPFPDVENIPDTSTYSSNPEPLRQRAQSSNTSSSSTSFNNNRPPPRRVFRKKF